MASKKSTTRSKEAEADNHQALGITWVSVNWQGAWAEAAITFIEENTGLHSLLIRAQGI